MQFSDVTSEYLKCHFCGMQVNKDIAHKVNGHLYHTKECYDFSLGYKDLLKKLEAVTVDYSPTARTGGQEAGEPSIGGNGVCAD